MSSSSNLCVIGNGAFGALVDRRGRVVWCSLEGFGGDPIFNSLLNNDSEESGWFDVSIENLSRTEQKYISNTGILITTLISKNGDVLQVKDFAPRFVNHDHIFHHYQFIRVITRVRGDPITTVRIRPSFEYNSADGYQTRGSHHIRYCGPNGTLRLTTNAPIQLLMDESAFMVHDPIFLVFGQDESITSPLSQLCKEYEARTISFWKNWCMHLSVPVDYQEVLVRSAITLQMMQSDEVGGIITSLTLGIPLGPDLAPSKDERNFQLPELCVALPVLRQFGLHKMSRKFFEFLKSICLQYDSPQAVYDYLGRPSCPQIELTSMSGFLGCGQVVAGNMGDEHCDENKTNRPDVAMYGLLIVALSHGFIDQRFREVCSTKLFERLELFGEQCIAAFSDMKSSTSTSTTILPVSVGVRKGGFIPTHTSSSFKLFEDDYACWAKQHPTSRVPTIVSILCWAGVDRLSRICESGHKMERSRYWAKHAKLMREEIFARAVKKNHFVSFWDTNDNEKIIVGPSLLRIAELGFIDPQDELFHNTINAFERTSSGSGCDGFSSSTMTILTTNTLLWYGEAIRSIGRVEDAKKIFHSICAINNEVGLFSQSVDMTNAKYWGNFPHTNALVGFMRLGSRLSRDWRGV